MKIKVDKLRPNPFRKIKLYPIDRSKVEALKISISDTSFWDNILARQKGKYFEIAYGHHRWIAIKELGIKEVDIPVRDLSDYLMVKIMAEENLNWSTSPAVVNETVLAAKEFLDSELAKYENFDKCPDKSIRALFTGTKGDFLHCKTHGVGRDTIHKFLGRNWKKWLVQEALRVLESEKKGLIDRKAVESLGTVDRASNFRKAIEDYKVPVNQQQNIAEKLCEEKVPSKRVRMTVAQSIIKKKQPNDNIMDEMEKLVTAIDDQARSLLTKLYQMNRKMNQLGIKQLGGVKTLLATSSLKRLFDEIQKVRREFNNETDS